MAALAVALIVACSSACPADQLQWNASAECKEAVRAIGLRSLLVSFCSLADADHIELWLVRKAYVVGTPVKGLYEVVVRAKRLYRSQLAFSSGELQSPEDCWAPSEVAPRSEFHSGIDLAYVYIHTEGNTFRCLGRVLGLECSVDVETISLPDLVMEQIRHALDSSRWS
jgi:hypothetical protein